MCIFDLKENISNTIPYIPNNPSYFQSIIHLFKGNIGPGLFAMGFAFKHGGLVVAPILTILIALISIHCQHMLINSSIKMKTLRNSEKYPDFAETIEQCFETGPTATQKLARTMKMLVNLFICITQLGFCCIYFVFISTNIKQVCYIWGPRVLSGVIKFSYLFFSSDFVGLRHTPRCPLCHVDHLYTYLVKFHDYKSEVPDTGFVYS